MTDLKSTIADEIRKHDPQEGWRRESYCTCGAPTEPYNERFVDHLADAITRAIATEAIKGGSLTIPNPYHEQLSKYEVVD